jgi:hypothetical protein
MDIVYIIALVCILGIVIYFLNYSNTLYTKKPDSKLLANYLLDNYKIRNYEEIKKKQFNYVLNNVASDTETRKKIDTALANNDTKSLEKLIKESTEVACSLAWNYLTDKEKDKFQEFWKTKPMGFHIHCPEGAVPKDGPSAGAALTLALYSLLTNRKIRNNVAMTGEINLQGQVMAIGGLEEKLEGAKRAGVTLALVPKENKKHLDKVYERNLSLFDESFKVEMIECFDDVVKHALLPALPTDTPMIKGLFKENDEMKELDLDSKIVNSPNTTANTLANTFVPPTPSKNKKPMK